MKVLLVEDDTNKANKLLEQIRLKFNQLDIVVAKSAQSGTALALKGEFNLLLLDMSLPRYDIGPGEDGYEFDFFAGREILFELVRNEVALPTLVVTQFETFGEGAEITTLPELDRQLRQDYSKIYLGAIYYSASHSDWKRELETKIEHLW